MLRSAVVTLIAATAAFGTFMGCSSDSSVMSTSDNTVESASAETAGKHDLYDGNTVRLYFATSKSLAADDIPADFNVTKVEVYELPDGSDFAAAYDVTMPRIGDYKSLEKVADALQSVTDADACDIVSFIDESNTLSGGRRDYIDDGFDANAVDSSQTSSHGAVDAWD